MEQTALPAEYPEWLRIRTRYETPCGRIKEKSNFSEADDIELAFREGVRYASKGAIPRGTPEKRTRVSISKNHPPNEFKKQEREVVVLAKKAEIGLKSGAERKIAKRLFNCAATEERRRNFAERISETDWFSSGC